MTFLQVVAAAIAGEVLGEILSSEVRWVWSRLRRREITPNLADPHWWTKPTPGQRMAALEGVGLLDSQDEVLDEVNRMRARYGLPPVFPSPKEAS